MRKNEITVEITVMKNKTWANETRVDLWKKSEEILTAYSCSASFYRTCFNGREVKCEHKCCAPVCEDRPSLSEESMNYTWKCLFLLV